MAKVPSWKKLLASFGLGGAAATQTPEEAEAAPIKKSLWHATKNLWLPEADVKAPTGYIRTIRGANPSMLPVVDKNYKLEQMHPLGRFNLNKMLTGEGNITEGAGAYTSDAHEMGRRYLRQFSENYKGDEYFDKYGNVMSQKEFNKEYPLISMQDDINYADPHAELENLINHETWLINKKPTDSLELENAFKIKELEELTAKQNELWKFIDEGVWVKPGMPKDAALYELKTDLDTDQFIDWMSPTTDPKNKEIMEILRDHSGKADDGWGLKPTDIEDNPYGNVHGAWDFAQTNENAKDLANDMLSIGKKGVVEWDAGRELSGHYNVPNANNFVFFNPGEDLRVVDRLSGVDKPRDWEKFLRNENPTGAPMPANPMTTGWGPNGPPKQKKLGYVAAAGTSLGAILNDASQSPIQARPLAERQKSQIMTAAPYDSRHAFENWVAENVYSGDSEQAAKTLDALDWTPAAIPIGAGHALNYLSRFEGKNATIESLIAALGPIGAKAKPLVKAIKKKLSR